MGPLPEEYVWPAGSGDSWLTGVVEDPEGKPIPGATVEVHAIPRIHGTEVPALHARTTAGPDGTFRVGPGPSPWSECGLLSAVAPGFARTSLRPSAAVSEGDPFADEGTPARVVLRPGVRVTGDVRAADGGPPDGPVKIWAVGTRDFSEGLETDAGGAFSLLAPRGQEVMLNVIEGVHPSAHALLPAGSGDEVRTSITVRRGRDIRGQVVSHATGKPVPGAVIRGYYGKNRIVVADGEGRFLLPKYWYTAFQVQAPGHAARRHVLADDAGTPGAGPETVRLQPGFSARGRVTDLDGRPVAKVRLRIFLQDPLLGWEDFAGPVTRADGTYAMIGLPLPGSGREVRLFAIAPGFGHAGSEPLAAPADGLVEGLDLRIPRLVTLEGSVEDERGRPVAASVTVLWDLKKGMESYVGKVPSGSRTWSRPDGRWAVRIPERSRFHAEAGGEAFLEGRAEGVSPAHPDSAAGATPAPAGPVVLRVLRGLALRGTVEDAQGNPVGRGIVHFDPLPAGSPGPSREVAIRPDGTFEAGGFVPGKYGLSVVVVPEFLQEIRLGLDAGGPPLRVVLRRAGGLNGRVVLPPEAPPDLLVEATVHGLGDTSPLPADHGIRFEASKGLPPGDPGVFTMGPLSPGPYALSVTAGDWILDRERVEVKEREPTQLGDLLLRPGAVVEGRVLVAGNPVAGAAVELLLRRDRRTETVRRVVTAADGSFRAGGLRHGPLVLAVHPQDRPRVEVPVEAALDRPARADVAVPLGGRVLVTVRGADGAPAAGARVLLSGDAGSLIFWKDGSPDPPPHRTEKDGTLRCTGVVPGKTRVYAEVPGVGAGEAEAEVVDGKAVPVEVVLAPR